MYMTLVCLTSSSRRACLLFLLAWSCLCSSCSTSSLRCSLPCCSSNSSSSSSSCSRVWVVQKSNWGSWKNSPNLKTTMEKHERSVWCHIRLIAQRSRSTIKVSHVCVNTVGTYKFSLILLDDISVVPLVLLHSQLGVLHINVVCQVIHCMGKTKPVLSKWIFVDNGVY